MYHHHTCTVTLLGKYVKVHYKLLENNLVSWDLARAEYSGTPPELLDIVEWTMRGTYSDHISRSCLEHNFYMSFHFDTTLSECLDEDPYRAATETLPF